MTLAEFLAQSDETQTTFARRVGVTPATISRIAHGHHKVPEHEILWRIFLATGGKVRPDDFYRFDERVAAHKPAPRYFEPITDCA